MAIIPASAEHLARWSELRIALWPWDTLADHAEEARELYLAGDPDRVAYLATDESGEVVAFAEASLRRDYVNGCKSSPVVFLEGICVTPEYRRSGIASDLATAVCDWGRAQGCAEFASDARLENFGSRAFHKAIGFDETEKVVFFRKEIGA